VQEVAANERLPSDETQLVKATSHVVAYDGMQSYRLEGDGIVLLSYNYIVMPLHTKGSLINMVIKVN